MYSLQYALHNIEKKGQNQSNFFRISSIIIEDLYDFQHVRARYLIKNWLKTLWVLPNKQKIIFRIKCFLLKINERAKYRKIERN